MVFASSRRIIKPGPVAIIALALSAMVVSASASNAVAARAAQAASVTLTLWQNTPPAKEVIAGFERAHPGITINPVVIPETSLYQKLRVAFKAGSGAPDVTQMEYNHLPAFLPLGKLIDLSAYGAGALKSRYVPWVWGQVSRGSAVYAIPLDSGPMALFYRKDIFARYHLSAPQTWDQYAREARTLHRANPKIYLGNSPIDDYLISQLLWQGGARPYRGSGSTITIDYMSAAATRVWMYWGTLIGSGATGKIASYTPAWYTALSNGTLASSLGAAWLPLLLEPTATKTSGDWRVAPLPQWTPGAHASANDGGSTIAVTTQSAHPKEAAMFAMYMADRGVQTIEATKYSIFPTLTSLLHDSALINRPDPFFGGQPYRQVLALMSEGVDTSFQWSPFQDYVDTQLQNNLGQAERTKGSFVAALQRTQQAVTSYARAQGFTVH